MNRKYKTVYGEQYFETVEDANGLNRLKHNTCNIIDFNLLVLSAGETYSIVTGDREFGFDVFTGVADFQVDDAVFKGLGGRKSVFDGPPSMLYAGFGSKVTVTALTQLEIGIGSCPSKTKIEPYVILPDDSNTGQWGEGQVTRHYRTMVNRDESSERLWFTEVFVQDGNWATYPPHKHEDVPGDTFQEEMYF